MLKMELTESNGFQSWGRAPSKGRDMTIKGIVQIILRVVVYLSISQCVT